MWQWMNLFKEYVGITASMLSGAECSSRPCYPSRLLGHRLPLLQPVLLQPGWGTWACTTGKDPGQKENRVSLGRLHSSHFLGNCTYDQILSLGPCLSCTTVCAQPCTCCPSPTAPTGLHTRLLISSLWSCQAFAGLWAWSRPLSLPCHLAGCSWMDHGRAQCQSFGHPEFPAPSHRSHPL